MYVGYNVSVNNPQMFKNAIYKVIKFVDMRKDFIYLDNFKLKIISSTNTDNKVHNYMIVTTLK